MTESNGQIDVNGFYNFSGIWATFYSDRSDVIPIGVLPAGEYNLYYHLNSITYSDTLLNRDIDTLPFIVRENLSVKNQMLEKKILIYPNPSLGKITINYPKEIQRIKKIYIVDLHSKICFQFSRLPLDIDLNNLENGIYFMILLTDNEAFNIKIILLKE